MWGHLLYEKECVHLLQTIIQIPSVNGVHLEAKLAEVLQTEAIRLGLPCRVLEKEKGRPNIFIGEPSSFHDPHSILFIAHIDTVSVGSEHQWAYPPFSGHILENKIYGRGAIDCKGGITLALYTLKALKDRGQLYKAKFIAVADEESGAQSEIGLKYVLGKGLKAKGAIYLYGGDSDALHFINIGHRGVLRVLVRFKGEQVHSGSRQWQDNLKGENAISSLATFIKNMENLTFPIESPFFPGYRFMCTPTLIQGGCGASIVPDEASVFYDIRLLPETPKESVLKKIKELANATPSKQGYEIHIKVNIPASLSNPAHPFILKAKSLHEKIFNISPLVKGSGPANESYMLIERGIPTLAGYGPEGGGCHSLNEYANLDSLTSRLKFLIALALEEDKS